MTDRLAQYFEDLEDQALTDEEAAADTDPDRNYHNRLFEE